MKDRMRHGLRVLVYACALSSSWLVAPQARAAGDGELDLRIGVRGALTLSDVLEADAPPTPTAAFFDSSWGPGFGFGLYGELHASKLFGVGLDLLIESNRIYFESSEDDVDFEQTVSYGQLRIPLLAKLFLQLSDSAEIVLGLGPELLVGLGAGARSDITDNRTALSDASVQAAFAYFQRAQAPLGAAIALELGVSFYTQRFHLPIAFRVAYNALGKTAYDERVVLDAARGTKTFEAIESLQLGLVIGFGFLIPPRDPPPPPVVQGPPADDPFAPFSGR